MNKYCFVCIVFLVLTHLNLAAKNNNLDKLVINLNKVESRSNLVSITTSDTINSRRLASKSNSNFKLPLLSKNPASKSAKKDDLKSKDQTNSKLQKNTALNLLDPKEVKKNKGRKIVTYRIYNDGRIEKYIPKDVTKELENKYKYVYFDEKENKHILGEFTIFRTHAYKGEKDEYVNLISLEEVPKYFKEGKYQYHFNVDSPRSYVNERTLASFFGAMLEVNFLDISCNGFSHDDGSSKPSRSHINGNNGDFKYLRKDQSLNCGGGTSLNLIRSPDSLDHVRQNKWNDALYKFGWKSMLGWSYKTKGKTKYLNHVPHRTANHYHHLHVQHFEPLFKEIKE